MKYLLALFFVVSAFAQRTPLKVNGSVISNPDFTDSAGVVFGVTGSTITAAASGITNSGGSVYITNLYVTNLSVQIITNVSSLYVTNLYVTENTVTSNLFTTNITVNNFTGRTTITSNLYVTNIYAFTGYFTNDVTMAANAYSSNLFATDLVVSNSISGTIDATEAGLTLIQRKSLKLQYPRLVDGTGCTYSNTNDPTAVLFMVPIFSATEATNSNYAEWAFRVPSDIDTTADLTASLTIQLGGADTDAATYTVGVVSIANSSAGAGTPANYVTLTIPADGSGADGDIESVNSVTLTGWAAALTANQWALVRLQRDGSDASAVTQAGLELELFYVSSQ